MGPDVSIPLDGMSPGVHDTRVSMIPSTGKVEQQHLRSC